MRGTGKADVYVMLADPIGHAKSPGMFNELFENEGFDGIMVPVNCAPEDLPVIWAGLTAMRNLKGMIISVPFKGPVFELCDRANPLAARVGTANSVRREPDGAWLADNFDGVGFVQGMKIAGRALAGEDALLVGAGGAGSSLAYCLAEEGAASLVISDIDQNRAARLTELVASAFPGCAVRTGPADPSGRTLVVNATPMGLRADDPYPLDVDGLTAEMTVVDIIMEPVETRFLKKAMAVGCKVQFGQLMMDCQMTAMADFLQVRQGRKLDD